MHFLFKKCIIDASCQHILTLTEYSRGIKSNLVFAQNQLDVVTNRSYQNAYPLDCSAKMTSKDE